MRPKWAAAHSELNEGRFRSLECAPAEGHQHRPIKQPVVLLQYSVGMFAAFAWKNAFLRLADFLSQVTDGESDDVLRMAYELGIAVAVIIVLGTLGALYVHTHARARARAPRQGQGTDTVSWPHARRRCSPGSTRGCRRGLPAPRRTSSSAFVKRKRRCSTRTSA